MDSLDGKYFLRWILEERLEQEITKQVGIIDIKVASGLEAHGLKNLHDAVAETTPQVARDFFKPLIDERVMWMDLHLDVGIAMKDITRE